MGPMEHLRTIHIYYKNKMKLYPKSTILCKVLKPLVVEDINWISHDKDAQYQYLKIYVNNECEYKIYTQ